MITWQINGLDKGLQISTQTEKLKRKSWDYKKCTLKKLGLKFWNPKINLFRKITFIFLYKIPTLCSSWVNKAILEQVKAVVQDYDYMVQFFKKQKLCKQNLVQKECIIWILDQNLFEIISIYLSLVSLIWNHLQKYFLQLEHHIELLVHQ